MIAFLLVLIFLVASLSLLSYLYCWSDVKGGRPHILSLRQVTGIMDRKLLNLIFGGHEPGYYYPLSPEKLRVVRFLWTGYVYREITADALCMAGAYRYMTGAAAPETALWFILLAGLCQGVNIVHSVALIRRWGHQIREELENSGE